MSKQGNLIKQKIGYSFQIYNRLMQKHCKQTCAYCSTNAANAALDSANCADVSTQSECESKSRLCKVKEYATIMRKRCIKTCGFC